jgi:tripartite ATP-independent transporter DctP family solute receptor
MKIKGKWITALILISISTTLNSSGKPDAAADRSEETILLRLAEAQVDTYPATMGVIEFTRLVEKRSEGRIVIEVYMGAKLGGDERAILEQVQFGGIDFTRVNLSPVTELAPLLNLLQMPYLYKSYEHMHNVLDSSIGDLFLDSVEKAQLVGLAFYDAGSRNFYNSVKPIRSIADMKGLKLRVPPSQLMINMVDALGATAVPMAFGEVHSALQTGFIDGAENNWTSYDMVSHHEVAKYITEDVHSMAPEILVASKMVMDKLSVEDLELIKTCARESIVYERALYKSIEESSRQKLVSAGVVISSLSDRGKFIEAVLPIYAEFSGEYKHVLDQIISMK